jgi:hypothetical protein
VRQRPFLMPHSRSTADREDRCSPMLGPPSSSPRRCPSTSPPTCVCRRCPESSSARHRPPHRSLPAAARSSLPHRRIPWPPLRPLLLSTADQLHLGISPACNSPIGGLWSRRAIQLHRAFLPHPAQQQLSPPASSVAAAAC